MPGESLALREKWRASQSGDGSPQSKALLALLCYLMKLVLAMLFGAGKIAAMNLSAAS
jgi:hypothetical protein